VEHGPALAATLCGTGVAVLIYGAFMSFMPTLTCGQAAGMALLLGLFWVFQQIGHTAFTGKSPIMHVIDTTHDIVCIVVATVVINYFRA